MGGEKKKEFNLWRGILNSKTGRKAERQQIATVGGERKTVMRNIESRFVFPASVLITPHCI